jgi:hypothetical protein
VGGQPHAGVRFGALAQHLERTEMDSFTYVNIFETKGLEYLLLLSFWVLFIYLVRYLSKPAKKRTEDR